MKATFKLAYLSAFALVSAVSFTACSSDDETPSTPNLTGETVKTSFTISIPQTAPATKLSDKQVLKDNNFQGMKNIQLLPFIKATDLDGSEAVAISPIALADFDAFSHTGVKAQVYSDISLPIGTNHFIFYGENKNSTETALDSHYGLTPSYQTTPLISTSTPADDIHFDLVPFKSDASWPGLASDAQGEKVLAALNDINASLITNTDGGGDVDKLQTNFITLTAGSALAVLKAVEDLYNSLSKINTTNSNAVKTEIDKYFTTTGAAGEETLTWTVANTFPGNIGLPDGAVSVQYNTSTFAFGPQSVEGMDQSSPADYVKPASLYYWVNTACKASNSLQSTNYSSKSTWGDVLTDLYTDGTEVATTTRSIALKDQIKYAVAQVIAKVKVAEVAIYANNATAGGVDQLVTVPTSGYTVTGILIGDQKRANWDFTINDGATAKVIYDGHPTTATTAKKGTFSDPFYTLALESKDNTNVKIAIEFQNDGEDFYGYNNMLIPNGSKFYLIATLIPSEGAGYPTINKVFQQNYQTTINLTIGATSLKSAYNVIPDLRAPKLELGLSVELDWKAGLTFEKEF